MRQLYWRLSSELAPAAYLLVGETGRQTGRLAAGGRRGHARARADDRFDRTVALPLKQDAS